MAFTSPPTRSEYQYRHVADAIFQQNSAQRQQCITFWVKASQYGPAFVALTDNLCNLESGSCKDAFEVGKIATNFAIILLVFITASTRFHWTETTLEDV